MDLRTIPLALSAWVMALAVTQGFSWWPAVMLAPLLFLFKCRYTALGCLAVTGAIVAAAAAQLPAREPPEVLSRQEQVLPVKVRVDTVPVTRTGKTSLRGTLMQADQLAGLNVPVKVYFSSSDDDYAVGSIITFEGRLRKAQIGRKESFHLNARSAVKQEQDSPWYLAWAGWLRSNALRKANQLPGQSGQLLLGLSVGETRGMSEELEQAMKNTSLTHLTAVSGSNCAIVIGIVIRMLSFLSRRFRVVSALFSLVLFVVLVVPDASIIRAAIMALAVLAGWYSGRPGGGIPLLSLAVIVMLLWNPWFAADYSFLLSVSATAGILLMGRRLEAKLSFLKKAAPLVAIPLAAQVACQPILLLIDPRIPLAGILANALADPVVPAVTILGLLAVLLSPFELLSWLCLYLGYLPAYWIILWANIFNLFPQIPWIEGIWGAAALSALMSLILYLCLRSKKSKKLEENA